MISIAGCMSSVPTEEVDAALETSESTDGADPQDEQSVEVVADVTESVKQEDSENLEELETQNVTESDLNTSLTSGSLDLQDDLKLCPHLAKRFSCDKYDIKFCEFTQMLGANDYYPNVLNCRDGQTAKGENPDHEYCLIQSCMPLASDGIVYAYGGTTAYAEYSYVKDRINEEVVLHYSLVKCGEMEKEFEKQDNCKFFRSDSGLP